MAYLSTSIQVPLYSFTIQTVQITTGSPETVVNDQYVQNPLGALIKWNDNVYRYVQFDASDVAGTAAAKVDWKTLTIGVASTTSPTWLCTADASDALGTVNTVAGVLKGVVTNNYYTFIAVGGTHLCQVAANMVAGDKLIGTTVDSVFARVAAGTAITDNTYGTALETRGAVVTNQSLSLLTGLIW